MKCPQCGYVSFDDAEECKQCGAVIKDMADSEEAAIDSKLQEELFSLARDDEEESDLAEGRLPASDQADREEEFNGDREFRFDGPVGDAEEEGPAEAVSLPDLNVDFDPAATTEDGTPPPGEDHEFAFSAKPVEAVPIIDNEVELPEDLWIEEGAGFLKRLAAFVVDAAILLGVLSLFLGGALLALSSDGYGWSHLKTPEGISALFVPFYLLGLLVSLGYFTFFVGWSSRTPGKALLQLDVRRTDGGEMSYSRAFLRWVGYLVSITFAGLGFLWVFFDERKRGWHDYLSGTWVKDLGAES